MPKKKPNAAFQPIRAHNMKRGIAAYLAIQTLRRPGGRGVGAGRWLRQWKSGGGSFTRIPISISVAMTPTASNVAMTPVTG